MITSEDKKKQFIIGKICTKNGYKQNNNALEIEQNFAFLEALHPVL